jgi:NAD(P)-dependent dehydrogenase (short-subunit alcohol dehydrogenase family)
LANGLLRMTPPVICATLGKLSPLPVDTEAPNMSDMKKHLYILTGASRGMGLAMAEQLLQAGHTLLCISRHANPALSTLATQTGAALTQWTQDLADGQAASERLKTWLQTHNPADWASMNLINNAGVIPAILPLSQSSPAELAQALRVGLEAPMQLCAAFLGATQAWALPRKVLNISSGLGRYAMASQAGYCAAKAGMDHFTRCMALDEALHANGAKVCSLAPGVIDTDMQVQMRGAAGEAFPDQSKFLQLKVQGQLSSPAQAATQVLGYLARPDFGDKPVADVRD